MHSPCLRSKDTVRKVKQRKLFFLNDALNPLFALSQRVLALRRGGLLLLIERTIQQKELKCVLHKCYQSIKTYFFSQDLNIKIT